MWWEQHVRWWEIPSIRSITLSSDTPVNVGCCDFSSGALCVWGEKKLKLWWLSMTRLKAWLHHLSHETHQQRGFVGWVPSGRRWCQWTNLVRACVFDREKAFERPVWLTLVIKVAYMVISPVSPSYALLTCLKLLPKVPSINGHTVNQSPQSTCNFPHYDLCHNMWPFPPLIIFQSLSF